MILEWLAPSSAITLCARLTWLQVREGWHGWEDILKTVGGVIVMAGLVRVGFSTQSVGESLVLSSIMLTMAVIPGRTVFRLIGAKRPNEIEDPELFEDGELKSEDQLRQLGQPKPD